MLWAAPQYAWLALLIIPVFFFAKMTELRKQHKLESLGYRHIHSPWICMFCRTTTFLLLVVSLCRPQWGIEMEPQESKSIDILIALDTSRSMMADDLPPTRLTAAKKGVSSLINRLQGDRIGLIAFAGSAFLVCPLTSDYSAVQQMLDETDSSTIPRGGSDIASILHEVQSGFAGTPPRSRLLILVSDGEDHGGGAAAAARTLRESGVTICSVTVGSTRGGIIPLPDGNFLKDRAGRIVRTLANPQTLELFSNWNAQFDISDDTLVRLYEQVRPLLLQNSVNNNRQNNIERFQLPLATALLFLAADFILNRRRT
jgi:Ca-activated chloride channel family protein